MTSRDVTITSKNQITLPADLVRSMKLDKNRRLTVTQRGEELILKPAPSLEERLQKAWQQLPPLKPLKSDEEFQQIVHEAWAEKEL